MKWNKLTEKLLTLKYKITTPKKVTCCRCEKTIYTKKEKYGVIVNLKLNEKDYYCEKCDKEHWDIIEQQTKERDEKFAKSCPLHKPCCLWCENCENKNECFDKEMDF